MPMRGEKAAGSEGHLAGAGVTRAFNGPRPQGLSSHQSMMDNMGRPRDSKTVDLSGIHLESAGLNAGTTWLSTGVGSFQVGKCRR